MYFHPLILTDAQKEQQAAAYQHCARLWLDGIERQRRLHINAVSECALLREDRLRELLRSSDITHFVVRYLACAASTPLDLLQVSMHVSTRCGEIAADVQREVAATLDRHTKGLLGTR